MNANLKTKLIAAAALAALSGPVLADDPTRVTLTAEASLDRTTIYQSGETSKTAWIQREYAGEISLGVDPDSGAPIHPHRSVQVQYVVDCSRGSLNMTAWKLFSENGAQGSLVWTDRAEGTQADYRYAPGSAEERAVVTELCNTSVAAH